MDAKNKFEDLLLCPFTKSELTWVSDQQLQDLNRRIEKGEIKQRNGKQHTQALKAAMKALDADIYYPQEDGIYCLLKDLALLGDFQETEINDNLLTKQEVQRFYDQIGWHATAGVYQDAKDSEDLRAVSQDYIQQCHLRLNRYLPKVGTYLLDVASGPIQYPAYLTYSSHYEYRICADISLTALLEAKKKLKDKGIYLLCDVTNLPLKENRIDAAVSLHTLYHVPKEQQSIAYGEIYRVLKKGGTSVVVYSWGSRSLLMNLCMLPFKLYSLVKRKFHTPKEALYFYAHDYQWFKQEIKAKYNAKLFPWRSVNVPFLKIFIHSALGGRQILKGLYWIEEHFHELMGRIGAYPLFVCVKK